MAAPKIREVALALVFVCTVSLGSAWATHRQDDFDNPVNENVIHNITYRAGEKLMLRLKTMLPVARLRNESAAHYLHVKQTMKWASSLPITQFAMTAGSVNFRPGWHPKPYSTGAEDLGMFQLGLLAGYTHFAMVNANIPEMKEYAVAMLSEFDTITGSTMLTDMNGDVKSIAQSVSDPSYPGGPTKVLDQFDAWTQALAQRVFKMYYLDGLWYYTAGINLSGLSCVPQTDSFNAPYFRDYLETLYNFEPSTGLPYAARYEMSNILRTHVYIWNTGETRVRAQRTIQSILAVGPGPVIIRQP